MSVTCFEIESKSDFLTGSYLITRIPEKELDQNALRTIQADRPGFILPFNIKTINGLVEVVYKIGTLCKLQHCSGEVSAKEYADLWRSLLDPLLKCGDWFMSPRSFVLDADYLYYDKNKKAVSYVYIPSVRGCSEPGAFNVMSREISKFMTVSDLVLQDTILRCITEDFSPVEFLALLEDYISQSALSSSREEAPEVQNKMGAGEQFATKAGEQFSPKAEKQNAEEDIVIALDHEENGSIELPNRKKEKDPGGFRLFGRKNKRKKEPGCGAYNKTVPEANAAPEAKATPEITTKTKAAPEANAAPRNEYIKPYQPVIPEQAETVNSAQSDSAMVNETGFRYVGYAHLPQVIEIDITEGELFSVGRFDASVGKPQSSFEFDKKTRAVSRRHAVIERDFEGYKIIDLSSSAGTYINDRKLPPNTPHILEPGCRISFGNSGADYIWEVS